MSQLLYHIIMATSSRFKLATLTMGILAKIHSFRLPALNPDEVAIKMLYIATVTQQNLCICNLLTQSVSIFHHLHKISNHLDHLQKF